MFSQISMTASNGGLSQAVSISSTSAQSAVIPSTFCVVYATTDCWMRKGSNPTALSNGTDQFLPANALLRLDGFAPGGTDKIAFITSSATGTVYITPGA